MAWVDYEYYGIAIIMRIYNSVFIFANIDDTHHGSAKRGGKEVFMFCSPWVGDDNVSLIQMPCESRFVLTSDE